MIWNTLPFPGILRAHIVLLCHSTIILPGTPLSNYAVAVSAAPSIVADMAAKVSSIMPSGMSELIKSPSRLTMAHASIPPGFFGNNV